MLGHLIRKEILDHILSFRFLILSAIGAVVIWLSLYDGYAYYQARLSDYRSAQSATEERIRQLKEAEGLVPRPVMELGYIGFQEHKPPVFLSVFIRGLDPTLGRSIPNRYKIKRLRRSPVEVAPVFGIFPTLDLGWIVEAVLGLFVLLLTYDTVSGEKEGGRLSLLASFPVPRHRLLLGKLFGILLPALAVFGLPLLLGIGVLVLMPQVEISSAEWVRLGAILLVLGLYLTAFTCAGILGSCLTHRSATSFVLLLTFWVATVVVVPRLSLIAADAIRPAPSVHEHQAKRGAVSAEFMAKRRKLHWEWAREYYGSAQWWNTPKWRTPEGREAYQLKHRELSQEIELKEGRPVLDRLEDAFRNQYNARLDLAVWLARLSPAFAFRNATVRLAGTGIDRHQRFESEFMRAYERGAYQTWLIRAHDTYQRQLSNPGKYGKPRWDLSDMPRFAYREPWAREELRVSLWDVGILALWGVVFFLCACVAMLRYDLR